LVILRLYLFFQAADGIRDRNVTGVQTCALPISSPLCPSPRQILLHPKLDIINPSNPSKCHLLCCLCLLPALLQCAAHNEHAYAEIGRASCRERVWSSVCHYL